MVRDLDKENESYIPEFIGTEKRMRLQVYKEARMQLAEYIKEKIYQAWVDYGKTEKIKEWYQQSLLSNKEFIRNSRKLIPTTFALIYFNQS